MSKFAETFLHRIYVPAGPNIGTEETPEYE